MAPLIAFIPLITSVATAATVGYELANRPSAPTAPTQAQTSLQQAQSTDAAAQAEAAALTKRRGMASTILTSPLGVGSGTAQTQKSTLGA